MLLFDHNLSRRLVARLNDVFPGAESAAGAGLADAMDDELWAYARERGLIIVTEDSDFNDLAVLEGPPPHVVWIQRGNCSTDEIEMVLRRHVNRVATLAGQGTAVLILR